MTKSGIRSCPRSSLIGGILTWVFFGLTLVLSPLSAQENRGAALLKERLESDLQILCRQVDGVVGYALKDLTSGETLFRFENETFPTASTIKVAVLLELFRQAESGTLHLQDRWRIDPALRVTGSGILQELSDPELALTASDVATMMIVLSDNFATNVCIQHAGMPAVNDTLEKLGFKATRLRRVMMDIPAARRGDENTSSPAEILQLLEGLQTGKYLSRILNDRLMAILKKDKESILRKAIPADIPVANKPGSLEGVRCDAGIVFLPGRPYLFVGMTKYLASDEEGEESLVRIARTVHAYFARLADSNIYGRAGIH